MKRIYTYLREYAKNIVDFEKNKMLSLAEEKLKLQGTKVCLLNCFLKQFAKDKNY